MTVRIFPMSHGGERRVSSVPPGIAWSCYTSSALLDTIKEITEELRRREEVSTSSASGSWETVGAEGVTNAQEQGQNAQGLKSPWTCGFHCRFCTQPCSRREGHTFHSCYEHRHRR